MFVVWRLGCVLSELGPQNFHKLPSSYLTMVDLAFTIWRYWGGFPPLHFLWLGLATRPKNLPLTDHGIPLDTTNDSEASFIDSCEEETLELASSSSRKRRREEPPMDTPTSLDLADAPEPPSIASWRTLVEPPSPSSASLPMSPPAKKRRKLDSPPPSQDPVRTFREVRRDRTPRHRGCKTAVYTSNDWAYVCYRKTLWS